MDLSRKLFIIFLNLAIYVFLISLFIIVRSQKTKLDNYKVQNVYLDNDIAITYNINTNTFTSTKPNSSVQKFIDCYEYPITEENFTPEMKSKLQEIYNLFSDNNYVLSFTYEDLYTGLHVSYNENQTYFSASTIKTTAALYLYKLAEEGKINLDAYMTYTPSFYVEGSGSLQYKEFGSTYTIRDLIQRTIVESDNVAYQMVAYQASGNGSKDYWKNKGVNNSWSNYGWGNTSSHDLAIFMKDLYEYSKTDTELSNELMSLFYKSVFPLIISNDGSSVAHKSGWHYEIMHDSAIVFDEYPYVLTIMTNKGYSNYSYFFNRASILIAEFHDIYWQNKSNYCYNQVF